VRSHPCPTRRPSDLRLIESSLGDQLLDRITNQPNSRLVALTWINAGARSMLTTKKKVETAQDLQGQKIRVIPNPILSDAIEAMGDRKSTRLNSSHVK